MISGLSTTLHVYVNELRSEPSRERLAEARDIRRDQVVVQQLKPLFDLRGRGPADVDLLCFAERTQQLCLGRRRCHE